MAAVNLAVVNELIKINCCNLCILRFFNEKDPLAYEEPENYIAKAFFLKISFTTLPNFYFITACRRSYFK